MIITDVLSHGFNKGHPIAFPDSLAGGDAIVRVGLISILPGQVYAFGVGVVAVSAFFLLLYKTRPGRAFRAIAEDPSGARLVGIPLLKTGTSKLCALRHAGWPHRSAARGTFRIGLFGPWASKWRSR